MDGISETQEFDMYRPPSPSQAPESSQVVPPADIVKWQSTQPLPALNALLRDSLVQRPARRASHSTSQSTFFFPDVLSSPDASSKYASGSRKPPSKTVAFRRVRPRNSDSSINPAPPVAPFSLGSPFATAEGQTNFVDILKSVSQLVDENARIKKRHLDKQSGRVVSGSSRSRKIKASERPKASRDELIDKTNVAVEKTKMNAKRKERLKALDADVSMDVDQSFTAMDVDIAMTPPSRSSFTQEATSSATKMPPPPVPAKVASRPPKVQQPPRQATSSASRSYASPPIVPVQATLVPIAAAPSSTPTSSFPRPPALGMRRTTVNPSGNSFTSSQTSLPSKQRAFKPPLAKSVPPHSVPAFTRASVPHTLDTTSHTNLNTVKSTTPTRSAPSGMNEDADSSFGELSFDMDLLEEAMKEYD